MWIFGEMNLIVLWIMLFDFICLLGEEMMIVIGLLEICVSVSRWVYIFWVMFWVIGLVINIVCVLNRCLLIWIDGWVFDLLFLLLLRWVGIVVE